MFELFTMLVRQGLLIAAGILIGKGYIDSSLTEPLVAFGLTAFSIAWRVIETRYIKKTLVDKTVNTTIKQVMAGEVQSDKLEAEKKK